MIKYHKVRDGGGKFLWVKSGVYVLEKEGEFSKEIALDVCERDGMDASVIVCWKRIPTEGSGEIWIYLRSSIRPAIGLREDLDSSDGVLWELPAGKIDNGESARSCAIRELKEEVGFTVSDGAMLDLGNFSYPAVGVIGERLYFFEVEVGGEPEEAKLDGSVLEAWGEVKLVRLIPEALEMVRRGELLDMKTELGIRRLSEKYQPLAAGEARYGV